MKIFLTLVLILGLCLIPHAARPTSAASAQALSQIVVNSFSGLGDPYPGGPATFGQTPSYGHKGLLTSYPGDGVYFAINGTIAPSTPQWTVTDNSGNEFRMVIRDYVGTPVTLHNKISLLSPGQINFTYEASDLATDPPATSITPVSGTSTEDWYFDLEQKISGVWTVVRHSQMVEPSVVAPNAHTVQDIYVYNGAGAYVFYKKTNAVPPTCPSCGIPNPKIYNGEAVVVVAYVTGAARALGPSNQQVCNRGLYYYPTQGQPSAGQDARHLIVAGIVSSGYPNVEQINFAVNTWAADHILFQVQGGYYEPSLFCRGETGPPSGDWYVTPGNKFSIDWQ